MSAAVAALLAKSAKKLEIASTIPPKKSSTRPIYRLLDENDLSHFLRRYADQVAMSGSPFRTLRAFVAHAADSKDAERTSAVGQIVKVYETFDKGTLDPGTGEFSIPRLAVMDPVDTATIEQKAKLQLAIKAPTTTWYTKNQFKKSGKPMGPFEHYGLLLPALMHMLPAIFLDLVANSEEYVLPVIGRESGIPVLEAVLVRDIVQNLQPILLKIKGLVKELEILAIVKHELGKGTDIDAEVPGLGAWFTAESAKIDEKLRSIHTACMGPIGSIQQICTDMFDIDRIREMTRNEQIEENPLPISDAALPYILQLQREVNRSALNEGENLLPGLIISKRDVGPVLEFDTSDTLGSLTNRGFQRAMAERARYFNSGFDVQATFDKDLSDFAKAVLDANQLLPNQNKAQFDPELVNSVVVESQRRSRADTTDNLMLIYVKDELLTRVAAVTNDPVPEAPLEAAEVDAKDGPKAEKKIKKPTGAEHILALQSQLSPLAPTMLQEVTQQITQVNADLRAADREFEEVEAELDAVTGSVPSDLQTRYDKALAKVQDLQQRITKLRDVRDANLPTSSEIELDKQKRKSTQTVDGVLTRLRQKRLAGEALTQQQLRILDSSKQLREMFGTAIIPVAAGTSIATILDEALTDHGKRHKSYALTGKEREERNRKVTLNWHAKRDAQRSKAVYLQGQAQLYGQLFRRR